MNIKSNKDEKSFLKSAWIGAKEVGGDIVEASKSVGVKVVISIIMFYTAYEMWEYSGLIALLIVVFNLIIIYDGNYQSPSVGEKFGLGFVAIFLVALMGTNNVYKNENRIIPVTFSKIAYTDSTEKTVIFMTEPIKKAVVVNFGASEYYMMKEQDQNLTVQIVERGEYTHWDKLEDKGTIDEYTYDLVVISPDQNFTKGSWSKKKNGDRQFVK